MENLLEYVKRRTVRDETTGCWNWSGATSGPDGRPMFTYQKNVQLVYRALWKHIYACELSKSDFICHHCDNPKCCNPDHLFLSDANGNNQDAVSKGRNFARKDPQGNLSALKKGLAARIANPSLNPSGANHWTRRHPERIKRGKDHWTAKSTELIKRGSSSKCAMFTERQIEEIRADIRTYKQIASDYGCHFSTIGLIKTGKHYPSVKKS